jgi:ABC-2 type transport system ATP-binding protein
VYPDLTAAGYLDYLGRLDRRQVRQAYVDQLLQRFDVSGVDLARPLRDQSHGMKQKIGIVQALMTEAPVLILDEPTAGLDPLMVQAFRDTLEMVTADGETTVFLSSHVLAEVESTCGRIGLVRGGRMVASETLEDLKRKAPRRVTVDFSIAVGAALPAVAGVTVRTRTDRQAVLEVAGPLGPLLQALSALPVHDIQIDPFRLEDYIAGFYGVDVKS